MVGGLSPVISLVGRVGDQRGQDEGDAAHGGRAALAVVGLRAVVPDHLPVALAGQQPDQQRGADQGQEESEDAGDEDLLHRAAPSRAGPPTVVLPAAPGRRTPGRPTSMPSPARRLPGALRCATGRSPPPRRTRAPTPHPTNPRYRRPFAARRLPCRPTATSLLTLSRTASRPTASCSASDSLAELGHLPEHRPRTAPPCLCGPAHRGECAQGGPHGLGVRVVGVVDDRHAVGPLGDLHPPVRERARLGERGGDLLDGHAQFTGDGGRGERVRHVVLTVQAHGHVGAPGGCVAGVKSGLSAVVEPDVLGTYVGFRGSRRRAPRGPWCALPWRVPAGRRR